MNYSEEKFAKKSLKLDTLNSDPQYLQEQIHESFPELSVDGEAGGAYKLWQVRGNQTELTALPVDVNNAQALFNFDELNRSCVYIKADESTEVFYHAVLCTLYFVTCFLLCCRNWRHTWLISVERYD